MTQDLKKICFVIMPFGKSNSPERTQADNVYADIKEAVSMSKSGLNCVRADEIEKTGSITHDIITYCARSKVVIADLSGLNPNVFYELGVRHSRSQGTIPIAEEGTKLPFDTHDERTIFYPKIGNNGRREMKRKIRAFVDAFCGGDVVQDSPVLRILDLKRQSLGDIPSTPIENTSVDIAGIVNRKVGRRNLGKTVGKKKNEQRIVYLLKTMGYESESSLEVPDFFSPLIKQQGSIYTLVLVLDEFGKETTQQDYFSLFIDSVNTLRKNALVYKTYLSPAEILSNNFGLQDIKKLVLIVPVFNDTVSTESLEETLKHHFKIHYTNKMRNTNSFSGVPQLSIEEGTVKFEIWNEVTINTLEQKHALYLEVSGN